jgi:hypothetical protein
VTKYGECQVIKPKNGECRFVGNTARSNPTIATKSSGLAQPKKESNQPLKSMLKFTKKLKTFVTNTACPTILQKP